MKKIIIIVSLVAIALVAGRNPVFAATYYVSTIGNDSNSCTSTGAKACATVNGAIGKAGSGDTIKIEAGNYDIGHESSQAVKINKSHLTIIANDINNPPIIENLTAPDPWDGAVSITAPVTLSYVTVDCNNKSSKWGPIALRLKVGSEGSHLDHIITRNAFSGVIIDAGKNISLTNCTSYNNGTSGTSPESGSGFGFATSGDGTSTNWSEKILLQNCTAYNNGGDGFQVQRHNGGSGFNRSYIEVDSCNFYHNDEDAVDLKEVSQIKVHHCLLHDNAGDGIVSHSGVDRGKFIEVYNNKVYNNGWWGIYTGDGGSWTIYNNLIYNNANGRTSDSYQTAGLQTSGTGHHIYYNTFYRNGITPGNKSYAGYRGDGVFQNNILFNNGYIHGNIKAGSSGTISHNYVYPTSPGMTGQNAIVVLDPKLVDPQNSMFQLSSGSPLIDQALDVGITSDFADQIRPANNGYDLGAYEYHGQSDKTSPEATTGLRVVQN